MTDSNGATPMPDVELMFDLGGGGPGSRDVVAVAGSSDHRWCCMGRPRHGSTHPGFSSFWAVSAGDAGPGGFADSGTVVDMKDSTHIQRSTALGGRFRVDCTIFRLHSSHCAAGFSRMQVANLPVIRGVRERLLSFLWTGMVRVVVHGHKARVGLRILRAEDDFRGGWQ